MAKSAILKLTQIPKLMEVISLTANNVINARNKEVETVVENRKAFEAMKYAEAKFEYQVCKLAQELKDKEKIPIDDARNFIRQTLLVEKPDEITQAYIKAKEEYNRTWEENQHNDIRKEGYLYSLRVALLDYENEIAKKKAPVRIEMTYPD